MNVLSLEQLAEQCDERLVSLERDRDDIACRLLERRQHVAASQVDVKPLLLAMDRLAAELALRDAIDVAIRRRAQRQAELARKAAADAPEAERLARERRYRSTVERCYTNLPTPALVAQLREVCEQNEFPAHRWEARKVLADIEANQVAEQKLVDEFKAGQKAAREKAAREKVETV